MPGSIILRYDDFGYPTIEAHRQVIDRHHTVWWGWWRKDSEPFPAESLDLARARARAGGLHIGLVCERKDEYFLATCTDIRYSPSGTYLESPNKQTTPDYYADSDRVSAWFRLTDIAAQGRHALELRFGPFELGEFTIYDVPQSPSPGAIVPAATTAPGTSVTLNPASGIAIDASSPPTIPEIVETESDWILHISDLHFGADHAYGTRASRSPIEVANPTLQERLIDVLAEENVRPGIIVVSGDLSTAGAGMSKARHFLEQLVDGLSLQPRHVIVVPGNHDIGLINKRVAQVYAHEKPYRKLISDFYGTEFDSLQRIQLFRTPAGWTLAFLALNSCQVRLQRDRMYGYLNATKYKPLLRELPEILGQDWRSQERIAAIAVMHHHLLPVGLPGQLGDAPISVTLDASQALAEFQKAGVRMVLHGHQHVPFLAAVQRADVVGSLQWPQGGPTYVLGCGGTGVNRLGEEEPRNSFSLYRFTENEVEARVLAFSAHIQENRGRVLLPW